MSISSSVPFANNNFNALTVIEAPSIVEFPKDILPLICRYLDTAKDMIQLALTNRKFYFLASDNLFSAPLWNLFLHRDFYDSCKALKSETKSLALYKRLTNAVHNMKAGKCRLQTLNSHRNEIGCMTISDGNLISGSWDNTIKIWDLKTGQELKALNGHQGPIRCMKILDGNLISGSYDHTIKIWDLKTGQELKTLNGHQDPISCMKILDGNLISGSYDHTIKIWDLKTGQELKTLNGHQGPIRCMKILDGNLISGSYDHTIKIWDLKTGQELKTLNGHQDTISCMEILDGNLISGSYDHTIKIWDLKTGQELKTLNGHQDQISCMKILDGNLISGSYDHTIKIWDLKTGQELKTLNGHQGQISCMKILDGNLISGSYDHTIKIWDLKTGQELKTLNGHQDPISCMKILDGKFISGSYDHTIKIWDFNFLSLSSHSKEVLEKNLEILGKMADAEHAEYMHSKDIEELAKQLHPDFQQRLKQHSYKMTRSLFFYSAAVILRVQTEVCVEALLNAIHDEDRERVSRLLKQLTWIDPQNTKIYELLWQICGRIKFDRWGECAFHHQQGCSASLLQKEQAVVEFKQILKEKWGEDLPLLLVDLRVVTKEEYSQKLECPPSHLLAIGICSPADLQVLGLFKNFFHFDYLKVIPEEDIESREQPQGMALIKKRQDTAFRKQEVVFLLLADLLNATQKMSKEAEHGALFAKTSNTWIPFQKKLERIQDVLNTKCQIPRELLSMFSQESYAKIVEQMNALIDEFQSVNREHQIAILYDYVHQHGIFKAWQVLYKPQGFESLSALLEQKGIAPQQDPFRMGI